MTCRATKSLPLSLESEKSVAREPLESLLGAFGIYQTPDIEIEQVDYSCAHIDASEGH